MLCVVMGCSVVQCSADGVVWSGAVQWDAVLGGIVWCSAGDVEWSGAVQGGVLWSAVCCEGV